MVSNSKLPEQTALRVERQMEVLLALLKTLLTLNKEPNTEHLPLYWMNAGANILAAAGNIDTGTLSSVFTCRQVLTAVAGASYMPTTMQRMYVNQRSSDENHAAMQDNLERTVAYLVNDERVVYAANCHLNAQHVRLPQDCQTRGFEGLSLLEKYACLRSQSSQRLVEEDNE